MTSAACFAARDLNNLPPPVADFVAPRASSSIADAPLLDVCGLGFAYGKPRILHGVRFAVRAGECVALLGSNGAGKSTLLRCCAGLITPQAGTMTLAGCDARPWTSALRRRVGLIFQKHQLVPQYSALTNVVHGRLGFPEGWRCCWQATAPESVRRKAMQCLRQVDLEHKALQPARSLSGGESQRVAIARVLIREPDLILADEPTASLDPVAGKEILERLRRLNQSQGVTLLIATHDVTRALEYTDRIIGLRNGEVVIDEPTGALTAARLQTLYGSRLLSEGPPP